METVDRIFELASKEFKDQKDFAAALGVSKTMVSAWRTGVSQSYERRLPQIAKVLGTTVSYLIGENEKPATITGDGQATKLADALRAVGVDVDHLTPDEIARIARLAKAALDE